MTTENKSILSRSGTRSDLLAEGQLKPGQVGFCSDEKTILRRRRLEESRPNEIDEFTNKHSDLSELDQDQHSAYPTINGSRGFSAPISGEDAVDRGQLATLGQVEDHLPQIEGLVGVSFVYDNTEHKIVSATAKKIHNVVSGLVYGRDVSHVRFIGSNNPVITINPHFLVDDPMISTGVEDGQLLTLENDGTSTCRFIIATPSAVLIGTIEGQNAIYLFPGEIIHLQFDKANLNWIEQSGRKFFPTEQIPFPMSATLDTWIQIGVISSALSSFPIIECDFDIVLKSRYSSNGPIYKFEAKVNTAGQSKDLSRFIFNPANGSIPSNDFIGQFKLVVCKTIGQEKYDVWLCAPAGMYVSNQLYLVTSVSKVGKSCSVSTTSVGFFYSATNTAPANQLFNTSLELTPFNSLQKIKYGSQEHSIKTLEGQGKISVAESNASRDWVKLFSWTNTKTTDAWKPTFKFRVSHRLLSCDVNLSIVAAATTGNLSFLNYFGSCIGRYNLSSVAVETLCLVFSGATIEVWAQENATDDYIIVKNIEADEGTLNTTIAIQASAPSGTIVRTMSDDPSKRYLSFYSANSSRDYVRLFSFDTLGTINRSLDTISFKFDTAENQVSGKICFSTNASGVPVLSSTNPASAGHFGTSSVSATIHAVISGTTISVWYYETGINDKAVLRDVLYPIDFGYLDLTQSALINTTSPGGSTLNSTNDAYSRH